MRSFQDERPGEIVISTSPRMLQDLFSQVKKLLVKPESAGYDTSRVYLLLDELLSNVYRHGYGETDGEPIGVRLRVQGEDCNVAVRDLAPTFDTVEHAKTRQPPPPEEGRRGGMGLVIIRSTCRSFTHQAPREGGNALYLSMKLVRRGTPTHDRTPDDVEQPLLHARDWLLGADENS